MRLLHDELCENLTPTVTLSSCVKQEYKHRHTTLFSPGQSWDERGRGKKETLACEPHNSDKCICPQMQLLIGAGQSNQVCFVYVHCR